VFVLRCLTSMIVVLIRAMKQNLEIISLISRASEIVLKILTHRLESKAEDFLGKDQSM